MSEFFDNYNTLILIIFRVFVVLEFLWKSYILLLDFKSEDAMETKDKRYFISIIIYSVATFILSFFLNAKYMLLFVAFRLTMLAPRLVSSTIDDNREAKMHKGKVSIFWIGFMVMLFLIIGGLVFGFVVVFLQT